MLKTLKSLFILMNKQKKQLILSMVYSFLDGFLLVVPIIISFLIISKIYNTATITSEQIGFYMIIMISLLLARILLRFYTLRLRGGAGYIALCAQRKMLGKDLRSVSMGYFSEKNLGDLVSTITSDAGFIEIEGMGVVEKIAIGIPSFIIGIGVLFYFDYRIALTILVLFIPLFFISKYLLNTQDRLGLNRQKEIGIVTEEVVEFIKGLQILKIYNMTEKEFYKTKKSFSKLNKFSVKVELSHIPTMAVFQLGFRIITSTIIFLSAIFAINGQMSYPHTFILMFASFSLFAGTEIMGIYGIFARLTRASIERMNQIKTIPKLEDSSNNERLDQFNVEFRNVVFAYESKPILKDISFSVPEKTTTALVGLSGSGKTTITNLIARFWDTSNGSVLIGGKAVRDISYENLLQNISFVFQNVFLFDDTVLNNICIGKPDATLEEVIEVAKKTRCHDFIVDMENGYDTIIGEAGSKLSEGEKQRISIARALIKNAPIVLLDEVTANVDVENEMYIQMALAELLKGKTVIMIAHKLSTIKNVEQILVIEDGQIIEQGKHEDLISNEGRYKTLWDLQFESKKWKV